MTVLIADRTCHGPVIAIRPTDFPAMAPHNNHKYQPKSKISLQKHASLSPSSACSGATKDTVPESRLPIYVIKKFRLFLKDQFTHSVYFVLEILPHFLMQEFEANSFLFQSSSLNVVLSTVLTW
jgi:hypothetical protein